jgi:hypothetical protein
MTNPLRRGSVPGSLEQKPVTPALLPERPRSRQLNIPKPDMSTAALESRLVKAVGSRDPDFLRGLLSQLIAAGELGRETDDYEVNFLLSVVEGVEPRDVAEAMLAAQMAMVHVASVRLARRFNRSVGIPQEESVGNAFNKLMRTFTTQMEALTRYRTGGGQNVTVGHVSVKAIVGNVTQGQHEAALDNAAPSQTLLVDAKAVPMPNVEESKERVPVSASRARRERSRTLEKK